MLQKTKIIAGVSVAALAAAAVPAAASYAATDQNATYSVTIGETLSLSYTAGTNTATVANGAYNTNITGGTLTAITNNAKGYTLTVKDADTDNSLSASGITPSIAAGTKLDGSVSNWALKASGTDAKATDWFAVPVSTGTAVTVAESSAATTKDGTATTITYGVGVSSSQPAGTYSDTVTYTIAKKTS